MVYRCLRKLETGSQSAATGTQACFIETNTYAAMEAKSRGNEGDKK
jgi:hypothetical protein